MSDGVAGADPMGIRCERRLHSIDKRSAVPRCPCGSTLDAAGQVDPGPIYGVDPTAQPMANTLEPHDHRDRVVVLLLDHALMLG